MCAEKKNARSAIAGGGPSVSGSLCGSAPINNSVVDINSPREPMNNSVAVINNHGMACH